MRVAIRPRRAEIPAVRSTFVHWLRGRGVSEPDCADLELVVSELTANAVEASPPDLAIEISMDHRPEAVDVSVSNCGPPAELPDPNDVHEPLAARGRGLSIVDALTRGLHLDYDPPVTTVCCSRPLSLGTVAV